MSDDILKGLYIDLKTFFHGSLVYNHFILQNLFYYFQICQTQKRMTEVV